MPTTVPAVTTSMKGSPDIVKQGIYDISSVALHKVGERVQLGERVFYYAQAGGSGLNPAVMLQKPAQQANHLNMACPTASAIGKDYVWATLGGTAVTLNQYAEGYLHINTGTNPFIAKIKSHLAQATTNGNVKINLYDPIPVATTTSSKVTLSLNPWSGLIVVPNGGQTGASAGVPLVAVTASYYFWCQTWGPAALLTVGTIVIGGAIAIGGTSDGACGPVTEATAQVCGYGTPLTVNATTTYSQVFLRVAP